MSQENEKARAAADMFDALSDDAVIYVTMKTGLNKDGTKILFGEYPKKNEKFDVKIRAFFTEYEVAEYCTKMAKNNQAIKPVQTTYKSLCRTVSKICKESNQKITCILNAINADGKMLEVETLWSYLNN